MYAGFWSRFAATLLDLLVLLVPIVVVPIVVALITGPKSRATMIADASVLVIVWLYFAALESSSKGATLGKIAFGIRVVDVDGNRMGFMRASGRLFAKVVSALPFAIGFLMAAVMPRKQALHDLLAGSLVVKHDALPSRVRARAKSEVERNRERFLAMRAPAGPEPKASAGPSSNPDPAVVRARIR